MHLGHTSASQQTERHLWPKQGLLLVKGFENCGFFTLHFLTGAEQLIGLPNVGCYTKLVPINMIKHIRSYSTT